MKMTSTAAAVVWNGLDGLINSKPFMPGASPGMRAKVMMELAEQDGELLGVHERRLVLRYAEAVRDDQRTVSLINELCESGHERQFGHVDLGIKGFVEREIAREHQPGKSLLA